MLKWRIDWVTPEGKTGSSEPLMDEIEAADWEKRMKAWWPERKFFLVSFESREAKPRKNLAEPYLRA